MDFSPRAKFFLDENLRTSILRHNFCPTTKPIFGCSAGRADWLSLNLREFISYRKKQIRRGQVRKWRKKFNRKWHLSVTLESEAKVNAIRNPPNPKRRSGFCPEPKSITLICAGFFSPRVKNWWKCRGKYGGTGDESGKNASGLRDGLIFALQTDKLFALGSGKIMINSNLIRFMLPLPAGFE